MAASANRNDESAKAHLDFLLQLPANRAQWTAIDNPNATYYLCKDTKQLFYSRDGKTVTNLGKNNKPVIVQSIKNASGGWIHVDVMGEQHFDLYCEQGGNFIFTKKCPY